MKQVDILGMGIHATIETSNRIYDGALFSKTDPIPDAPAGYIVIDVNVQNGDKVITSHSVERFDKETFTVDSLKGDNYMIVENKPIFSNILPLDDLRETIK